MGRPVARRALIAGGAILAGGAAPVAPGLHRLAQRRNRFFGSAVGDGQLKGDPAAMARVAAECGMVVGEAAFKWGALRPRPDRFEFGAADALAGWASRNAVQVRGHTLLWHKGNPDWLTDALTPGTGERLLDTHVRTVVGHFRHALVHWDVANEVLRPADDKPAGFRDSPWFKALGPAMLDIAFGACAATDPAALRVLNEDQIDYAWPAHERKRAAVLELLAGLRARGVPVQALGMQAHLEAGVPELDQKALERFCADVASLGLRIVVTELDVRDNRLPGDPAARDAAVAAHARAYLDAILPSPAVLGVLSWGFTDRQSWLNDELPRADKLPQRALPLDAKLRRKPLWAAIAGAYEAAPVRPP